MNSTEFCESGTTCTESASSGPLANLSDYQLDFYACLNELDGAVGRVLNALDKRGTFVYICGILCMIYL